jgi:hypothetical protein
MKKKIYIKKLFNSLHFVAVLFIFYVTKVQWPENGSLGFYFFFCTFHVASSSMSYAGWITLETKKLMAVKYC